MLREVLGMRFRLGRRGRPEPTVSSSGVTSDGVPALAGGAVAGATGAPTGETHIGIVCVHGIGFQEPGRTLLEWTDPIARALVAWRDRMSDAALAGDAARWPRDLTHEADIDLTGEKVSTVTFRIPGLAEAPELGPQRWTFTEAFWAARVEPPSLRLLIDWTGREGMVGRVVSGILDRNAPSWLKGPVHVAGTLWLGFFISALSSLVLLAFYVARSVLAIIPIPALRNAVVFGKGERFLVGWWGDARSLVRDPVQAASVRRALADSIADLRTRGCDRIVVLAHSGGTIVSYMTLADPAYPGVRADTLITHGQAVVLARRLEDLEPPEGGPQVQVQPSVSRIGAVADRDTLRVGRWRDFFATHDPAPMACPQEFDGTGPDDRDHAIECTNVRSIREDHGGYWANDETFVLPVMTEIERAGLGAADGGGAASGGAVAARSGPLPSRFVRPDGRWPDADGVRRRESRVALRSLWGRLALAGPVVTILLAAGIARGIVMEAEAFDAPSRFLAEQWPSIPGSGIGDWLGSLAAGVSPELLATAVAVDRAAFFVIFTIATVWAFIPVGGWIRRGAAGWWLADGLISAVVLLAAIATVRGFDVIPGIEWPPEFTAAGQLALGALAVGAAGYVLYVRGLLTHVPRTAVSMLIAVGTLAVVGAAVIAFIGDEDTRRWIVNAVVAYLAVGAVVRLGMWRWAAWDAAERQWFRGPRTREPSRFAPYVIAVLLGGLVALVVATVSGLGPVLASLGVPGTELLVPITVGYAGALLLFLVIRDVSTAEAVRT
jgi:hypothetical protein